VDGGILGVGENEGGGYDAGYADPVADEITFATHEISQRSPEQS
jgi:hypothetical protein